MYVKLEQIYFGVIKRNVIAPNKKHEIMMTNFKFEKQDIKFVIASEKIPPRWILGVFLSDSNIMY